MYEGVQVTTVARSIVDAAAEGVGPEQIQKAIGQALERAMVSPEQLRAAAARPGYRHKRVVQPLIDATVAHAAA
ncbi:MAG: hypothetical protein HY690_03350 [Chloroflexi bacterium]|nr:hypothetical protein [Chloroflexota bacterium]